MVCWKEKPDMNDYWCFFFCYFLWMWDDNSWHLARCDGPKVNGRQYRRIGVGAGAGQWVETAEA